MPNGVIKRKWTLPFFGPYAENKRPGQDRLSVLESFRLKQAAALLIC